MYNLIRRIKFPEHMNVSADVVKADTIKHVDCYTDLIKEANHQSRIIIENGRELVKKMRASARDEAAKSVQEDLKRMLLLSKEKENQIFSQINIICQNICNAVLEQYFEKIEDAHKIEILISELLRENISSRELSICGHPSKVKFINDVLVRVVADSLNVKQFKVVADEDIHEFELRLKVSNGSEIRVSLENIVSLLRNEVEHFINETNLIKV